MSPTTRLLKSKETRSRDDLADFLETMAARIREGQLTFQQGTQEIVVVLPEDLRVDVEVSDSIKPSRRRRELEIEMYWDIDEQGQPTGPGPGQATLT